jgi:hypothetical protein
MKRIILSLAGFVTLFGLMAPPVQSTALPMSTFQARAQPEAKTFTGTILKNGQDFVFMDAHYLEQLMPSSGTTGLAEFEI